MKQITPIIRTLGLSALLGIISGTPATATDRPNIIILYIDDLARGDVGAFGCPDPGTENIDRLADLGVRFDNAYTHNAPCSPSRTALMMGGYTQRFGKYGLSRGVPIPEDKPTLAETLRDAGYLTAMIGHEKWDIGKWDQGALDRGFMVAAKQPPRLPARDGGESGSWYIDINGSYGWITVEEWDKIKHDPTQWSEFHARERILKKKTSNDPPPLLEKLPVDLPHDHFGDTDPAGWHILLKLREATPRHVRVFQMKWRPSATPSPLTPYDRKLLPKLLNSPLLSDVRKEIAIILEKQDRGDFEQETLKPVSDMLANGE